MHASILTLLLTLSIKCLVCNPGEAASFHQAFVSRGGSGKTDDERPLSIRVLLTADTAGAKSSPNWVVSEFSKISRVLDNPTYEEEGSHSDNCYPFERSKSRQTKPHRYMSPPKVMPSSNLKVAEQLYCHSRSARLVGVAPSRSGAMNA